MGEFVVVVSVEVCVLQVGIDLGMMLIDIVEMYVDGQFECVVGKVIVGCCEQVYLVSKVLLYNVSECGIIVVCEVSFKCLGIDYLDFYLLYWCGLYLLLVIIVGMEILVVQGKICGWGVSNFDIDDMDELVVVFGGEQVLCNQVLYNFLCWGIEYDLLLQVE